MCMAARSLVACDVELGHELAVGGAARGELAVAFVELDAQIGGLLFHAGDRVAEGVDAGGRAGLRGVDLSERYRYGASGRFHA
jgi:hypothetical protein